MSAHRRAWLALLVANLALVMAACVPGYDIARHPEGSLVEQARAAAQATDEARQFTETPPPTFTAPPAATPLPPITAIIVLTPVTPPGLETSSPTPMGTVPAMGTPFPTIALPTLIGFPTLIPIDTPGATPTPAPASLTPAAPVKPTPVPAQGPLAVTYAIVGWQPSPSTPNDILAIIQVTATGGNGTYTYYLDNQLEPGPLFTEPSRKCATMIHAIKVISGDGQSVTIPFYAKAAC